MTRTGMNAGETMSIILASNSPRRKELLRQIGLTFSAVPADVDERARPGEDPGAYALRVAGEKAAVAAGRAGAGVVIAADTIVLFEGAVLGKPADARDAERMLAMLSGRAHHVLTGVVVMDAATGRRLARSADTQVWFRSLTADEISAYVASGEPFDKAGAYGIQERGALLVSRIEGCYFNVVGLPVALLAEMLSEFGIKVL